MSHAHPDLTPERRDGLHRRLLAAKDAAEALLDQRLEALPEAPFCMACQESFEREG